MDNNRFHSRNQSTQLNKKVYSSNLVTTRVFHLADGNPRLALGEINLYLSPDYQR